MNVQANVKLSKEESELVQNSEWILTKHSVTNKVITLFGELSEEYRNLISEAGLHSLLQPEPKISKGEQYERLPYVMLDFPRVFKAEDVFAVRSFFWWGNFFSINLHVGGAYKQQYFAEEGKLALFSDWMFCVSDDPWNHAHTAENFLPFEQIAPAQQLQRNFIKLSKKIPLNEWNDAYSFYKNCFRQIIVNLVS